MVIKLRELLVIVAISALTLSSFSVVGLLQSTERIGASGIIVRPIQDPIITPPSTGSPTLPPPEPQIEIDVFSDPQCTNIMTNVDWGEIEAGSNSAAQIYVKNDGDINVVISLITEGWSSNTAQNNMQLSWNYNGSPIGPGEIRALTLTLSIDPDCPELNSFGFDIIIIAS